MLQVEMTSAEEIAARFGEIRIPETNASECSLCIETESNRIEMYNCMGNKMRKAASRNRRYIHIHT